MFKILLIATLLYIPLYADDVTGSPTYYNNWSNFINSRENDEVTSQPIFDTEDSSTTTQVAPLDTSTTTRLSSSTENIENDELDNDTNTTDWKILFVCVSMLIIVLTLCKCGTVCIPDLCEIWLEKADARIIRQRERESTSTTTAATDNGICNTCNQRTPHQVWPYANTCQLVLISEFEPIPGPALPKPLPPHIMTFPMDNEAFTDDEDSDIEMTERAQNCETPPPPYSAVIADTDTDIDQTHELDTVA